MKTLQLDVVSDHPATQGHFPAHPIVPGAVLLDSIVRAAAKHFGRTIDAVEIPVAKFLRPVEPGAHLLVEFDGTSAVALRFSLKERDQTVATGQLRLVDSKSSDGAP